MLQRSACGEERCALSFRPNAALGRRHGQFGGSRLADVDPRYFSDSPAGRISALRAIGRPPKDARFVIEMVMHDRGLQSSMADFTWRIFLLYLLISLIITALIFVFLHLLIVRPLRWLTENIVDFQADPEDESRPGRRLVLLHRNGCINQLSQPAYDQELESYYKNE